MNNLTEQLRQSQSLDTAQVATAVAQLTDETISAETKAEFLTALSQKGETVEEIAGFARELREKSIQPQLDAETRSREILDVCGTGGDHQNTFNISTTVALVVAAAGVTVAKHGNRAVTSQSGSADVLEALGIKIDLSPEQAALGLKQVNFAFFFAPKFHPAFKHLALARKLCAQRGQRTIFNLLGPLLNPARPTAQLIGVPRPTFCEPVARVLQMLGIRRGMVVSGTIESADGQPPTHLDELSILGETFVAEFYHERGFNCSTVSPNLFSTQFTGANDLVGGDSKANAEIVRKIFSGDERGAKRAAVMMNAAAALLVSGKVNNLSEGWDFSADLIQSGTAERKLNEIIEFSKSCA